MENKIVLIDGHSILNRAFYGIPDLTNSEGLHTNAILGFLNILFKILEEEKATNLLVAFDLSAPTFRHEMYAEYKGTRKPMAEELRQQVPVMKELLSAMNITIMEKAGYEADDILGTISKKSEQEGYLVSIITGDKDLLQLASSRIKIRIPKTKPSGTVIEDYYEEDVINRYTVTPTQFIDLKALMGDASDNIPGIPGVGEKTAMKIISKFHSIENAHENIEEVAPNKAKQSLMEHYDLAVLSKKLAAIKIDCELEFDIQSTKMDNIYNDTVYNFLKRLEFKSIIQKFNNQTGFMKNFAAIEPTVKEENNVITIDNLNEVEELFTKINQEVSKRKDSMPEANSKNEDNLPALGFYFVEDNNTILGLSLSYNNNESYYIKIEGFVTLEFLTDKINTFIQSEIHLVTINLKEQLHLLTANEDSKIFDISVAAYLLNPLKDTYTCEDIARDYLKRTIPSKEDLIGKLSFSEALEEKEEEFMSFSCYNAHIAFVSKAILIEELKKVEMLDLFNDIEMPLVYTLYDMEQRGIKVDTNGLKVYGDKLMVRIEELEKIIHQIAGKVFNINSPKQLGEILFGEDNLKLTGSKKTKTGYSTSADVLEKLADKHEIIPLISEYRQLTKLKSTYADGLANYVNENDKRIHGKFNQTITATGRISSTEPNLQNIPIRMELGREIRKVFIPEEDYVFVDADYSQIELRVLAHISEDKLLINAYKEEQDIHKITASEVFHIPLEEVTSAQRSNAKAVNFGIVYGISSFGLGQDLNITKKEAQTYIEKYFETYQRVKVFLDETVEKAKNEGYVTTMFNRRRPIPEINSSNFIQRSFGERVAMNSPIQGSAADIIKIAMIKVNKCLKLKKMKSRLILQIHDELLIETHKSEIEQVKEIITKEMQEATTLNVPLEIDINTGMNWYESK